MSDVLEVKRIVVLGAGSAGLIAAATLKVHLPQIEVIVLASSDLGIIGVGEGTTTYVPEHLHGYMRMPVDEFFASAEPTWKLGVRFLWGPRPAFSYPFTTQVDRREPGLSRSVGYYCEEDFSYSDLTSALMQQGKALPRGANGTPIIGKNLAYHLENESLVKTLHRYATKLDVRFQEGTVAHVECDDSGVRKLQLTDGSELTADLYVDCSGFRSELLARALGVPFESFRGSLFCDRAIVGGWSRTNEPILPYTTAETMNAGWCWQIEHERRINRGYVYSSDFLTDEQAETEFRKCNPLVEKTRIVPFVSGAYVRSWEKNVVAIGNSSGFVEPLEATALNVICAASQALTASLIAADRRPERLLRDGFNDYTFRLWQSIRRFLAVHYRFNTRLDTPFWRACRSDVDLAGNEQLVEYYQEYGPDSIWLTTRIDPVDPFRADGLLTLLIGQRVPYRRAFHPSAEEAAAFQAHRTQWWLEAQQGFDVAEGLRIVRLPQWKWTPGFYR